jgi:hypothetical protein
METSKALDELVRIKVDYVDSNLEWYRRRTTWPRVAFRVSGLFVIGLSLALPLIAAWAQWAVPLASVAIAIVSALASFFSWQRTWEKRIAIQLELEGMIAHWNTEMVASRATNDSAGFERALKATHELVDKTRLLTAAETSAFFAGIRFPQAGDGTRKTEDEGRDSTASIGGVGLRR